MKKPRLLVNVHFLLLVGLVGYAIFSYTALPERYAVHFNLQGEADRWTDKGSFEYWLVPAAAVGVGMLLLLTLKYPRYYNYPQKDQVNRWPEHRRLPVFEKLGEVMMVVAILVDVIFISVQVAIINSAAGEMNIFLFGVLGPTLALPVVLIVYLVKISSLVNRIEGELKMSGSLANARNA